MRIMWSLHENSHRLLDLLEDEAPDRPHRERHGGLAEALAKRMPLSHGTTRETFLKICKTKALLSQKALIERGILAAKPESTEAMMGTDAFVFFFAGPFSYPKVNCGFLLRADIEDSFDEAEASPFDSGGLLDVFSWPDDGFEDARAFLDAHRLPVPQYREYLRKFLGLYFGDPWHYIDGKDPVKEPIGITGGDRRRWTAEVRFSREIRLEIPFEAVFVTRDAINHPSVEALITRCHDTGIHVHLMDTQKTGEFKRLQDRCKHHFERVFRDQR